MFVSIEDNDRLAKAFWQGKPSGKLMWSLDAFGACLNEIALQAGYDNPTLFCQKELGCLIWGTSVDPTRTIHPAVSISEKRIEDVIERTYVCPNGVLTERLKAGQIVKYKVNNADELAILIDIWRDVRIEKDTSLYEAIVRADTGRWPILLTSGMPSAVQHMLQYETGVENFWYLLVDCPARLEEAMAVWQAIQQQKYEVMRSLRCDGFYQAENTSTTMISPAYYQKYSLNHIQQLTDCARQAGVRTLVHMCGHLKDLMPLLRQTGMNGIHALSPPPIGNTPFEYAYQMMPADFFALGRFGSLHWIGRSQPQIEAELSQILPRHIYTDHAFVLLVTADGASFTADDLYRLRDAINHYDQ